VIEDRQREGCGLPVPVWRDADDVALGRSSGCLAWIRWVIVAFFGQGAEDRLCEEIR